MSILARCGDAVAHQVAGDSRPFLALWSHGDDVAILGAFVSHVQGWERVKAHLLGASKKLDWARSTSENIVTFARGDLGYSAWLERMAGEAGGPPKERTLRVTQVYRREDGQRKVILRHANVMTADDERNGTLLVVEG